MFLRVVFVEGSRGTSLSLDLGEWKGGGEGKGKGKGGGDHLPYFPPPTGFCLKYHPGVPKERALFWGPGKPDCRCGVRRPQRAIFPPGNGVPMRSHSLYPLGEGGSVLDTSSGGSRGDDEAVGLPQPEFSDKFFALRWLWWCIVCNRRKLDSKPRWSEDISRNVLGQLSVLEVSQLPLVYSAGLWPRAMEISTRPDGLRRLARLHLYLTYCAPASTGRRPEMEPCQNIWPVTRPDPTKIDDPVTRRPQDPVPTLAEELSVDGRRQCLSVRPSVPKSRMEGHSKLKIGKNKPITRVTTDPI